MKVSILGLNKAMVLMALYNGSRMQGMSFLGGDGGNMNLEQAENHLRESVTNKMSFDYLNGKVMKISLISDVVDLWLYDRDNGAGAGLRAINSVCPEAHVITDEQADELSKAIKESFVKSDKVFEQAKNANPEQSKGRMDRSKPKTKKKPQPKIEYKKGFFTVNGEMRTETKKQKSDKK